MREIPSISKFKEVAQKLKGHKSNISDAFGVCRSTLDKWIGENPEFKEIIIDSRMRKVDDCIDRAYQVAMGIPEIKDKKIVGWVERPDGNMLRYLLSTLGKKEGFGETQELNKDMDRTEAPRTLTKEEAKELWNKLNDEY